MRRQKNVEELVCRPSRVRPRRDVADRGMVRGWQMSSIKAVWCRLTHNDIAYGGGRAYWCRKCLCRFPVPWLSAPQTEEGGRAFSVSLKADLAARLTRGMAGLAPQGQ